MNGTNIGTNVGMDTVLAKLMDLEVRADAFVRNTAKLQEKVDELDVRLDTLEENADEFITEDELNNELQAKINDTVENAMDEALDDDDLEDRVEDAVNKVVRDLDLSDAVKEAMREHDFEDTCERVEEVWDMVRSTTEQFKWADHTMIALSAGGFWRRLRWLITGR